MGYIYKIKNTINNKVYIGQTIRNPLLRKEEHFNNLLKGTHHNSHLQHSFNKYGDVFEFEIIETCPDDELNEREIALIEQFNTYHKGYNETKGGEGFVGAGKHRVVKVGRQYGVKSVSGKSILFYSNDVEYLKELSHHLRVGNLTQSEVRKMYQNERVLTKLDKHFENNELIYYLYDQYLKDNFKSKEINDIILEWSPLTTLEDFKANILVKTFDGYYAEEMRIAPYKIEYEEMNILSFEVKKYPDFLTINPIYNDEVSETYVITDIEGLCERFDVIDYRINESTYERSVTIRNWDYDKFVNHIRITDYSEDQYKENGRIYKRFLVDKIL